MITDALVRWISPVLSFTADEIWQHLRQQSESDKTSRAPTVFTQTYLDTLHPLGKETAISASDWALISEVRDAVSKSLETLRSAGDIGGALEASVTLYASEGVAAALDKLGDELRFVLITSTADVLPLENKPTEVDVLKTGDHPFAVASRPATGNKCVRCWHLRDDVGSHAEHPEVCERCISNVYGDGELRAIA
ncbi:UNVERIFIED_CONTAM: hypothetical protein GTU68_029974 [Idotea baltica]|nr:hypothetical protein [Idotea baltica]